MDIMSSSNLGSEQRDDSFREFYLRYGSFLHRVCRKVCNGFDGGLQLADDVFQNTMLKVYDKAQTFSEKNTVGTTEISTRIKKWLSRIARNELINFLRKNPDEKRLANSYRKMSADVAEWSEPIEEPFHERSETLPTIQQQDLEASLASLSDKERHIVLTYMEYYDPSQPNRHLPEDILRGICETFSITSENVRKIKSRSMQKLKGQIKKNTDGRQNQKTE